MKLRTWMSQKQLNQMFSKKTDIFATYITENFNNMIKNSVFPDSLKQTDINPVYKKRS